MAQMTISRQPNGRYRVINFDGNHNHDVVCPNLVHMLSLQRRLAFSRAVEADLQEQENFKQAAACRFKDCYGS